MRYKVILSLLLSLALAFITTSCGDLSTVNTTSTKQMVEKDRNQANLVGNQPAPNLDFSLERLSLTKRLLLMNDPTTVMYLYVFIEGDRRPVGYYMVYKVSSTNSQLSPLQFIQNDPYASYDAGSLLLDAPSEDGSYGPNEDGVFGMTPDDVYVQTNMKYIVSTAPIPGLEVPNLGRLTQEQAKVMRSKMDKLLNQAGVRGW